ncbi:MAG: trypsin-like peptidase domain-containing protein [Anaerolineae bacterium]
MSNRSISGWILVIVALALLVGIAGGGVMGGAVSYYVLSQNHAVGAVNSPAPQLVANRSTGQAPATTNLSVTEDSAVIDVSKKASPAVVTVINTLQAQPTTGRRTRPVPTNPFGNPNGPTTPSTNIAEGSGVIIDTQGHIITNNHVVDGAQKLDVVYADGTKVSAKLIGADAISDLAVLQVSGNVPATLSLGDSNALQIGETVVAIGSPLGSYRGSVTVGIVSGLNRSVDGSGQDGLIQTDAAINHGNSGGPLVNLAGQVVGINTLVVRDTQSGDVAEGLGFAIPSNVVSSVVNQLIAQGKVSYPFIGVTYNQINPQSAAELNLSIQQGVIVQDVSPGTPAASAGIQANDVITAIDGTLIDESHSLRSILYQHQVGDTVTLTVMRNGQTLSVKLTLAARPGQTSAGAPG